MSNRTSGGGLVFLLLVLALLLLIVPAFAASAGLMNTPSQLVMTVFGVVLLILVSIILTITRLYHRTSADQAFVRTGMGGPKAVIDGGALLLPVVHEVIPVSLQTMRLDVERSGPNALITGDNLRVDVEAEFYIKVQKRVEDVIAAATSLGERSVQSESVKALVFQKLVSALRTVAATRPLDELHTKRDDFAQAVQQIVAADLAHNGLTLESVTISKLDQTPPTSMRGEDNVFDARGLRRIAEVTQNARIERNTIEREADKRVKEQDVERDLFVYKQDVARSEAEAARDRDIQRAQALAKQEADTFAAEQARLAGIAQVERDRAIEIAEVQKAQSLEVANQERERAVGAAQIDMQRAVELAARDRDIAIAQREMARAEAEASRFRAEAEMEAQRQAVETVQVTATAEREKAKAIIEQQAEIERTRLREQMSADVRAYAEVKNAEAEQQAAERRAAARLTMAAADKDAKALEADGDRAVQMVPVDVDKERVGVERARVDVERERLKNQAEFESIARELQVELAKIEAMKEVRIETARALGAAVSTAKMTVWGSPDTVTRLTESFFRGQENGLFADGLLAGASDATKQSIVGMGQLLVPLIASLTGRQLDPRLVEEALAKVLGMPSNGTEQPGVTGGPLSGAGRDGRNDGDSPASGAG